MQTTSQVKSSGAKVPQVHRIEKSLVPHVKPERLKSVKLPTDKRLPIPKPRIGQGGAGIREKSEGNSAHTNAHTNTCPKCNKVIA